MDEKFDVLDMLEGRICNITILNKSGSMMIHDKQKVKIRSNMLTLIDLNIQIDVNDIEIISYNDKNGLFRELRVLNNNEFEKLMILGK